MSITSNDDITIRYDKLIKVVRNQLDSIEMTVCNTLFFTHMNNEEFREKYYGVVNLSSKRLTSSQYKVLGKGLKFCCTPPRADHGLLKESLDRFFRTCSLKLFFKDIEPDDNLEPEGPYSHKDLKLPS